MTTAFLIVGGLSVALLLVAVVVGDFVHLGGIDADGPFSLPAIAGFLGGGGFGGAIASALLPGSMPDAARLAVSLAAAGAVALPLGWGALRFAAGLMHLRTDETLTSANLLGVQGIVVTAIGSGFGEVRLTVGGHTLKYNARSQQPLPAGTPVYVIDVPSSTSVEVVSTAFDRPAMLPTEFPSENRPEQHPQKGTPS